MQTPPHPRKGRTLEVLDLETAQAQKGWEHNTHLSPDERVALIEHLREMWHGAETIHAGVQRVFEFTERL